MACEVLWGIARMTTSCLIAKAINSSRKRYSLQLMPWMDGESKCLRRQSEN